MPHMSGVLLMSGGFEELQLARIGSEDDASQGVQFETMSASLANHGTRPQRDDATSANARDAPSNTSKESDSVLHEILESFHVLLTAVIQILPMRSSILSELQAAV